MTITPTMANVELCALLRIPLKANTISAPSRTPVPVRPNTIGAKRRVCSCDVGVKTSTSERIGDQWKHYADQLNRELGGRYLRQCHLLDGRRFAVTPGALKACGSATHKKGTPTICEYHEPNVSAEAFLSGLAKVIRANQTDDGPCVGCRYLQAPTKTPEHPFTGSFFAAISLHDFCGCNSRCVYCAGSEYFLPTKYVASQDHEILFRNLFNNGMIKPKSTAVEWGGGEPTLVNTFDRTVQFLSSNRIPEVINTSGIRFSPAIERALQKRTATVRISVDSGTNGTYSRVKRNRHCDDVWESIRRYTATGGDMIVKYIIFSMNSDTAEVEAFIDRCAAAGAKRICISVDVRSAWVTDADADRLTERELRAAAAMYFDDRLSGMFFRDLGPGVSTQALRSRAGACPVSRRVLRSGGGRSRVARRERRE